MGTDYAALLNETQLEAVTTQDQYVRIIAGAGSGKTRVLTYRIAYLMECMHVDPHAILAVTFTNKAAQEMKERVAKIIGDSARFLSVSTFHSFCARFLRAEAHHIGFPASFTIFDEDDVEKLIKGIVADRGHKKSDPILKAALHYIDSKKTRGLYPEDITITHETFQDEKECLEIYKQYEIQKIAMLAMDFDDLLLVTLQILESFPEVQAKYNQRYTHILIDEYQDTNDIQYRLIKLLVSPSASLCVVGDPDQTIYTWRGANQGIILNFPHDFAPCHDIILARNYRSTKTILDTANRLIAHNNKRVKKDLYTEEAEGDKVLAKRFESAEDEAHFVAEQIIDIAGASWPVDYTKIAVLYRSSYLTRPFESEFASKGIPYRIFGGLRFYQRREVKDVLAYFRLLLNPKDNVSFERIVNVPKRNIGDTSARIIKEEASALEMSEYDYCANIEKFPDTQLPKRVVATLLVLTAKMELVKQDLKENLEAYSEILRKFITEIGYFQYIVEDQGVDEDRAGNVNALFDDITHFIKQNPESTFDEYLQNLTLLTAQDDMNGGNYVSLMTVHVAKGLEFDNVFIIGLNEGAFPSYRSQIEKGDDGLEEERRLAYVAFTRAKKKLILTCNSGYSYTTDSRAAPSPFFAESGITFPEEKPKKQFYGYGSGYGSSYGGGRKNGWKTVGFEDHKKGQSFFSDGDAIDPFEPVEEKKPEPQKQDNGIRDWRVGDRIAHDKFGEGKVVEIIDESIIVVLFDNGSKKTLLSSHPMIKRLPKPGAEA
ncbi:MAG: UvrD-helicase domain-containing protein [Bacilli bacterium]|nr:UvrD-helicase domain-containing protein [Bacilli bacterium]